MPYYVSIGGQSYGPAEPDELLRWHKAGSFSPSDFVWDESLNEWVDAARFAPLAHLFEDAPGPVIGIEEIDELPREIRAEAKTESGPDAESWCSNHETARAAAVCPRCQKAFCSECMVSTGGIPICIDCVSSEKSAATRSPKRTAMVAGSVLVILTAAIGAFLFLGPKAPPQPATLEHIAIQRGEAPALAADTTASPDSGAAAAPESAAAASDTTHP